MTSMKRLDSFGSVADLRLRKKIRIAARDHRQLIWLGSRQRRKNFREGYEQMLNLARIERSS